ncbi:MAG: DUF167 domain-containing protein [Planctomycetes bacterium]|nr:DUF167 domain-containing protein [Planctomycetota bacterium]
MSERSGREWPRSTAAGGVAVTDAGGGRLLFAAHVLPGASSTAVGGTRGGALLVRVAAPPEGGRANAAAAQAVARALGLRKSAVEVVGGATSRRKILEVHGVAPERLAIDLAALARSRRER